MPSTRTKVGLAALLLSAAGTTAYLLTQREPPAAPPVYVAPPIKLTPLPASPPSPPKVVAQPAPDAFTPATLFHDVRAGKIAPATYFAISSSLIPDYAEAKKDGIITGFVYNPEPDTVAAITRESLKGRVSAHALEDLVEKSVKTYVSIRDKSTVCILPATTEIMGAKIPQHLTYLPKMLVYNNVRCESDVASQIRHAISMSRDIYHGITLGDTHIDAATVAEGKCSDALLAHLLHVRAHYKELHEITRQKIQQDTISVSNQYMSQLGFNFRKTTKELRELVQSDFEDRIVQRQMEEHAGIQVQDESHYGFNLRIRLYGTDNVLKFKDPGRGPDLKF